MPKSLPLVLLLFPFCISCNRYQYATINSQQLDKNDRNEFVFENDDLVLVYNFMGQDLGPDITIENKLSVPIYIDWRESALISNGHSNSYAPINVDPNGNVLGGPASSTIDFIAPRSYFNKAPLVLSTTYMNTIPGSKLHRTKYTAAGASRTVKTARFTEANSPLRFRSYITYMVGSTADKPLRVEHNFYISDLMNTVGSPENILQNGNHGNQFYTSKLTTGGGIGVFLYTSAIAGGVYIVTKIKGNSQPY